MSDKEDDSLGSLFDQDSKLYGMLETSDRDALLWPERFGRILISLKASIHADSGRDLVALEPADREWLIDRLAFMLDNPGESPELFARMFGITSGRDREMIAGGKQSVVVYKFVEDQIKLLGTLAQSESEATQLIHALEKNRSDISGLQTDVFKAMGASESKRRSVAIKIAAYYFNTTSKTIGTHLNKVKNKARTR